MAKPVAPTLAVCIGIRPSLVHAIANVHDDIIVAPTAPYYGKRDGMEADAWEAHKLPIREAAKDEASALMGEALKRAAVDPKRVTVYVDSMCFGLTDAKGEVVRWATIAEDDSWRQTGGLLRTMGAVINHV